MIPLKMSFCHEYKEESIQCPYDKHHIILKSRFINHLCKCRKLHRGTHFSLCPFNATHNIPTPELQYHVKNCSDRRNLDSHIYVVGDKSEIIEPVNVEVPTTEDWDDEPASAQSYLDVKDDKISNQKLLRLPRGKSKAQRKEFFVNETQRFEKLSRGETCELITKPVEQPSRSSPASTFSGVARGTKIEIYRDTGWSGPSTAVHSYSIDVRDDDDSKNNTEKSCAIVLKNKGRGRAFPSTSKK